MYLVTTPNSPTLSEAEPRTTQRARGKNKFDSEYLSEQRANEQNLNETAEHLLIRIIVTIDAAHER